MHRILFFVLLIVLISCKENRVGPIFSLQKKSVEEAVIEGPTGWKSLLDSDFFKLDIRYATQNNFVEEKMYDCGKCYLRSDAAEALKNVARSLQGHGFKLVLFDCYRPKPVQQLLWEKVPDPNYVTPPEKGSMHNRGVAVDLSIIGDDGKYLDMGTSYDYFGREAHTDYFEHTDQVLRNRKLLTDLMTKYGFRGIRTEWWHYSLVDGTHEIADWEWDCP